MDKVQISLANINAMLDFIGSSNVLPQGWTIARVAHLVSNVQAEAAASREATASQQAEDNLAPIDVAASSADG